MIKKDTLVLKDGSTNGELKAFIEQVKWNAGLAFIACTDYRITVTYANMEDMKAHEREEAITDINEAKKKEYDFDKEVIDMDYPNPRNDEIIFRKVNMAGRAILQYMKDKTSLGVGFNKLSVEEQQDFFGQVQYLIRHHVIGDV
jgi:hypothetical protein